MSALKTIARTPTSDARQEAIDRARMEREGNRFLGTWSLPSGNSADVYLDVTGLRLLWDVPPSATWSVADRRHWERVTYPAIVAAVGEATGQPVMCVWVETTVQ